MSGRAEACERRISGSQEAQGTFAMGQTSPFRGEGRKVRNRRKGDTPHFDPEPIADCDPSLGIETGQNPVPAEHARFAEARFAPR